MPSPTLTPGPGPRGPGSFTHFFQVLLSCLAPRVHTGHLFVSEPLQLLVGPQAPSAHPSVGAPAPCVSCTLGVSLRAEPVGGGGGGVLQADSGCWIGECPWHLDLKPGFAALGGWGTSLKVRGNNGF